MSNKRSSLISEEVLFRENTDSSSTSQTFCPIQFKLEVKNVTVIDNESSNRSDSGRAGNVAKI